MIRYLSRVNKMQIIYIRVSNEPNNYEIKYLPGYLLVGVWVSIIGRQGGDQTVLDRE